MGKDAFFQAILMFANRSLTVLLLSGGTNRNKTSDLGIREIKLGIQVKKYRFSGISLNGSSTYLC